MDEPDVEVVHIVPSMLFPVSLNLSNFTLDVLSSQRFEFDSRCGLLNFLDEPPEGCQRLACRHEDPLTPLFDVDISQVVRFPWKAFHLFKPGLRKKLSFVVKLASVLRTDYRPSITRRFNERMPSVRADVGKAVQLTMLASQEEERFS